MDQSGLVPLARIGGAVVTATVPAASRGGGLDEGAAAEGADDADGAAPSWPVPQAAGITAMAINNINETGRFMQEIILEVRTLPVVGAS